MVNLQAGEGFGGGVYNLRTAVALVPAAQAQSSRHLRRRSSHNGGATTNKVYTVATPMP